jgi:hypothetical protein
MQNGFYDISKIQTQEELIQFFRDAIKLASIIEVQYKKDSFSRKTDYSTTIEEYLEKYISLTSHNVCINRQIYNQGKFDVEGEIGSAILGSTNRYLNIYMSIEKLELLTNKYNLKLLEF